MTMMNDKTTEPISFKIVILGDSGVGKTSMINRYIKDSFKEDIFSTTGGSYFSKMIQYPNTDFFVKLDIWDTAGQERYRAINKIYYQKCNGVILVYDITKKASLDALEGFYTNLINTVNKDSIKIIVVGNKNDLYSKEQVSDQEGRAFATAHNALFKLVSALNANGINDLFETLGLELLKKGDMQFEDSISSEPVSLNNKNHSEIKTKECAC